MGSSRSVPLVVGLVVLTVAIWSAPAGLHWLDSGELVAAARWQGVAHPPGHPAYASATLPFLLLPVANVAVRASWASATWLALGWAVVAWLLLGLGRSLAPGVGESVRGAWVSVALPVLAGALGTGSLLQGARPEVYALHGALVVVALALLLVHGPDPRARVAAAFVVGLGLANHHYLVILAGPSLVLSWSIGVRSSRSPRGWAGELLRSAGALVLGLATYAYLPLRAASTAPLAWGDPETPGRFWWVVSAKLFQKAIKAGPGEFVQNLGEATLMLMEPIHPVGFAAAMAGAYLLVRRGRWWVAVGLWLFWLGTAASQSLISLDYFNPDLRGYFLPAVMAEVVLLGVTGVWLWRVGRDMPRPWLFRGLIALLLGVMPLRSASMAQEPLAFPKVHAADVVARAALAQAPPHGVLVSSDFSTVALLWGARAVTGARPDVSLVHRNYLSFPGWIQRRVRLEPGLGPLLRAMGPGGDLVPSPLPGRPLWAEPYHNLPRAQAALLDPREGLFHPVVRGGGPRPFVATGFWRGLYDELGAWDLRDPQTRRYLFWQHVLQGSQYHAQGLDDPALAQLDMALGLAPGSPEVLGMIRAIEAGRGSAHLQGASPDDHRDPSEGPRGPE